MSIKYSGAFVMTLVAKKIKKRENIDNPDLFLTRMSQEWASGLGENSFMGGVVPNGADLAVYGITRAVEGLRAGDRLQENPGFGSWMKRMRVAVNG